MSVSFEMPNNAEGRLQVLSINGQLVETIAEQEFTIGENVFNWDASDLVPGSYIIRLQTMERILTQKVVR